MSMVGGPPSSGTHSAETSASSFSYDVIFSERVKMIFISVLVEGKMDPVEERKQQIELGFQLFARVLDSDLDLFIPIDEDTEQLNVQRWSEARRRCLAMLAIRLNRRSDEYSIQDYYVMLRNEIAGGRFIDAARAVYEDLLDDILPGLATALDHEVPV